MIGSILGGDYALEGFSYLYKNNYLNDIIVTFDINGRLVIGNIKTGNKNIELLINYRLFLYSKLIGIIIIYISEIKMVI